MSLVGFRAQNHPQQAVRDDVDDRHTPPTLFAERHALFRFTVDAAASAENALLPRFWTREDDGLAQSWVGERVWCNPPYSNIGAWVKKAAEGGAALVDMLLPANRTEQRWWQEYIEPFREARVRTRFLPGRMRFGHPAGWATPPKGDRPPFGVVLVTWGTARPRRTWPVDSPRAVP
jgi:phage N-6-adenine-methyltransferase